MTLLYYPYPLGPQTEVNAVQYNANLNALRTLINGGLDNTNIAQITYTTANTQTWGAGVTGDTNPRIVLNTDHGLEGGPGNAVVDVVLSRSAVNTWQIATPAGGAAVLDMNTGKLINTDSVSIFGGADNIRPLPTTGTLTGEYWHNGNWTQTGAITSTEARIHLTGTMTINNTWTVNTECAGGAPGGTDTSGATSGGAGAGFGAGSCNSGVTTVSQVGGGGAGHGGSGGRGGANTANIFVGNGGATYPLSSLLTGSGGGGGSASPNGNGGGGGNGGGSLYIEATGNITCTAACSMTANGSSGAGGALGAGSGGAGSGGGIMMRSLGTVTLTAGGSMTATGGTGGAATAGGAAGGGGGGGIIDISGSTVTAGFTPTAGAGGAGAGGTVSAAAGNAGIVNLNSFIQNVRSAG